MKQKSENNIIRPSEGTLKKIHSLKKYKGKMAVIEPLSGEWFLGDTTIEAINNATKKFPKKKFYIIKIGYKAAGILKFFVTTQHPINFLPLKHQITKLH